MQINMGNCLNKTNHYVYSLPRLYSRHVLYIILTSMQYYLDVKKAYQSRKKVDKRPVFCSVVSNQKQPPRGFFKISLFFFSRSNLLQFCLWKTCLFVEQTCFFPGGFLEQTCFFECLSVRRTDLIISHRTDTNFPRNSYLVLEHIFQEPLFSHRTDIWLIGLGGCFRVMQQIFAHKKFLRGKFYFILSVNKILFKLQKWNQFAPNNFEFRLNSSIRV